MVVLLACTWLGCGGAGDSLEIRSIPPRPAALVPGGYDPATPIAGSGVAAGCPGGMARVGGYCIDRYEAPVVEIDAGGNELPHSPYATVSGRD